MGEVYAAAVVGGRETSGGVGGGFGGEMEGWAWDG